MNKSSPLISVVIPTYNHAKYLDRALKSVIEQTYKNWEIIVVDNFSSDNTEEVVLKYKYSKIKYIKVKNNGVIAKSRNMGISNAKGDWIAFLDSDDWWEKSKLDTCINCIKKNTNIDLIYHDLKLVNKNHRTLSKKRIKSFRLKKPIIKNLMLKGNIICNSSVIVRKKIINEIGGINESKDIIAAEDFNTWLRVAEISNNFIYLPLKLGFYFEHSMGVSQKDMSAPTRAASKDFLRYLNDFEKKKFEARMAYIKGKFEYSINNITDSKVHLLYTIKHGYIMLKFRASLLLLMLFLKNFTGQIK